MTFKRSMISISAAAVIAATITGCGSSSDTAAVAATAASTQSNVAADGYILNAVVTGSYLDDKNATQTVTYDRNATSTNIITTVKSKGDATYTINDANSTLAIRYKTLTAVTVAPVVGTDNLKLAVSFIDVDNSGDYNQSVDTAFTATLNAPATFGPITLFSDMVYNQADVKAMLEGTAELNQTIVDNATASIAKAFNLSTDDLINIDPVTKAEYNFVNAQIAAFSTAERAALGKAMIDANVTSTSLEAVFTNIVAKDASKNANMINIKQAIADKQITSENIASINADKTRANGGSPVLVENSTTAYVGIVSTTIDALENSGDKFDMSTPVGITFAKADENKTSTVDLLVKVTGTKARNELTGSASELMIKLSDINLKSVKGSVPTFDFNTTTSTISYEWKNVDANTSNIANFVTASAVSGTMPGVSTAITASTIDIGALISAIDTNVTTEANASSSTMAASLKASIASVQIALADADMSIALMGTTTESSPTFKDYQQEVRAQNLAVAGSNSDVTGSGLQLLNTVTDSRASVATGPNAVPVVATVDVNGSTATAPGFTTTYAYNDTAAFTQIAKVMTTVNGGETNDTVELVGLPTFIKATKSPLVIDAISGAASADFNLTVDTNLSTMVDTNTTVSIKVTDEFEKVNTDDANVSFFFDAIPTISMTTASTTTGLSALAGSGLAYTLDVNVTEHNNTGNVVFAVANMMGDANTTITTSDINGTLITDVNTTTGKGTFTITDLNTSDAGTLTITINPANGSNVTLELNATL